MCVCVTCELRTILVDLCNNKRLENDLIYQQILHASQQRSSSLWHIHSWLLCGDAYKNQKLAYAKRNHLTKETLSYINLLRH